MGLARMNSWGLLKQFVGFSRKDFLSSRVLTFSFSRAWVYVVFFSGPFYALAENPLATLDRVYIVSLSFSVGTLAIGSILARKMDAFLSLPRMRWIGPTAAAAGTLCVFAISFDGVAGVVGFWLCAMLTGAGSGLILLDQGSSYSKIGGDKAAMNISLAFLVSAAFYPIFMLLPTPIAIILVALLPLLSVYSLHKDDETEVVLPFLQPKRLDKKTFMWKIGLAAVTFGLFCGLLRDLYMHMSLPAFDRTSTATLVIVTVLTALFIRGTVLFSRRRDLGFVYRPVLLLCISSFLLLPMRSRTGILPIVLSIAGYSYFEMVIWTVLSDMAYRYDASPSFVFGFGRAAVSGAGVLLGVVISRLLISQFGINGIDYYMLSIVAAILMVVTYLFILTEKDVGVMGNGEESLAFRAERRLENACREISQEHGLSKRETEILLLISQNKTAQEIQDELFISSGTCNTHTYHIYQKLGMHTKKEVCRYVDSWEGETER